MGINKMNIDPNKGLSYFLRKKVQHYNPNRYWKYRTIVTNPNNKTNKFIKLLMLYYIKKSDAYNNASFGTNINSGAYFKEPPILPHGLNGIIISHNCKIGGGSIIFQQVTIADNPKNGKSAIIGDNVMIGAGAKIIGDVKIGNNVKIGANAVVVKDIPDNCTAVGVPAKIIKKK